MARISEDLHAGGPASGAQQITLRSDTGTVKVPSNEFIAHADITRDGQDLVLRTADGHAVVVKGYFSAEPHPVIQSPSGAILTPDLVHSFVHHDGPAQYAATATANDASPVGAVREVHGHATVKHADGTSETIIVGTAIHEGDVVETDAAGAINITFRDNSSFAVSHNAKLAIDEYVFDPHSDAGASNFSMLRGVFVYTSGQIGHQDPDDVHIHTPAGSIGIRGTIIAGDVDTGQITVVEGAIVLQSNTGEETVLSTQYATAQFNVQTGTITSDGTLSASDLSSHYSSLNDVAPSFFSGLGGIGTTTAPHDSTPDSTAPAPDSTTPSTPSPDGSHTQAAPDTTTMTADATTSLIIATPADTIGSDGGTFGTNDVFSTAAGTTTDSSVTAGTTDATSASTTSIAGSLTSSDTSSAAAGSTTTATTSPIVGQIFAGNPAGGTTPPPVPPAPPLSLDISTLSASGHGFWITDSNNEGFGSSTTVATNSGGLDSLLLVKNANDSVPGGLFFGVAGSTAAPVDLTVPGAGVNGHPAQLLTTGAYDNMVIASVGAFGPAATPCFIIGSPVADSTDPLLGAGTGNITIVDSSGALIEAVTGLGVSGLNVGAGLFGNAVAGIGDLNHDGYADVLIGSPGTPGQPGAAYVLYGSAGASPSSPIDLNALVPSTGFSITGATGTANLGADVSSAGDFNNDGRADYMVSTPGTGLVNVYIQGEITGAPITIDGVGNGSIHLSDLGDVSGDGVTDIGITANNAFYMFKGGTTHVPNEGLVVGGANFTVAPAGGTLSAGAVGDFNGDGKADIGIVITNGNTANVYVVYGGTLPTTAVGSSWLNDPSHAFHMVYTAPTAADLSAMTIKSAGDMNGDGLGDVVIGLPNMDTNPAVDTGTPGGGPFIDGINTNDDDGAAMVVYGQTGGTASYASATATANGQSVVGSGALSDGGFTNVSFSGSAANDTFQLSSLPRHLSGGNGTDEAQIVGNGTSLDFSALGSSAISGIEKFMMEGSNQTLTLTLGNIFQLLEQSATGNLEIIANNTAANTTLTINSQGAVTGGPFNGTGAVPGAFGTALGGVNLATTALSAPITESDGGAAHTFNVYNLGNNQHLLVDTHITSIHVV